VSPTLHTRVKAFEFIGLDIIECGAKPTGRKRHLKLLKKVSLMDAWAQLLWDRTPETDAHLDRPRSQYAQREAQAFEASLRRRRLLITNFVSRYAIGDRLAVSGELMVRSSGLLAQSRRQVLKCRMPCLSPTPVRPVSSLPVRQA